MARNKLTGTIAFKEKQQFRQAWLWTLLIFSAATSLILLLVLGLDDLRKGKPGVLNALGIVSVIHLINLSLFYYTCLETHVTDAGIFYRWRPFFRSYNIIAWSEIQEVVVRKYTLMSFGYHVSKEYGKVYNTDGGKGIQLILQNGKKVFIGSQRIAALESAIGEFKEVSVQLK